MKKLLYSLLALPMFFVACGEVDTPVETPKQPSLELQSNATMEFPAEGGEGTITFIYDLSDEVGSQNVEITGADVLAIACDANWVEVATEVAAYAGSLKFVVAENESEEARQTTITATIDTLSFVVTVNQAGAEKGNDDPNDEPIDQPKDEFVQGWAINGTMNDWVKKDAIAMTEEGDYFVAYGFELAVEDNFNFILNGNEKNYGGNGQSAQPDYVYDAKSWGSNISVVEAGTYDIYLSSDLKHYYIMTEGTNPESAEVPLKPGEKRWTIKGDIKGYEDVMITFKTDSRYCTLSNVEFTGDAEFYIYCNIDTVYGVAAGSECVVEEATAIVEGGDAIKVAAVEGQKYDIYYSFVDGGVSQLWVMPAGQYPVVWTLVSGGFMSGYQNFICYFVTRDVELVVDFSAGVSIVNNVIPEGTYYVQDTEDTGFCFDLSYCQVKVRGFETKLMDGTMTVEHVDGKYNITIDMRTPQFHIIKMHWMGEFEYDSFFTNMGGSPIGSPEK